MDAEQTVQLNIEGDASTAQNAIRATEQSAGTLEGRLDRLASMFEKVTDKLDSVATKLDGSAHSHKEAATATDQYTSASDRASTAIAVEAQQIERSTIAYTRHIGILTRARGVLSGLGSGGQAVIGFFGRLGQAIASASEGFKFLGKVIGTLIVAFLGTSRVNSVVGYFLGNVVGKFLNLDDTLVDVTSAVGVFGSKMQSLGAIERVIGGTTKGLGNFFKLIRTGFKEGEGVIGKFQQAFAQINKTSFKASFKGADLGPVKDEVKAVKEAIELPVQERLIGWATGLLSWRRALKQAKEEQKSSNQAAEEWDPIGSRQMSLYEALSGSAYKFGRRLQYVSDVTSQFDVKMAGAGEKIALVGQKIPLLEGFFNKLGTKVTFAGQGLSDLADKLFQTGDVRGQFRSNINQIADTMQTFGVSASEATKILKQQQERMGPYLDRLGGVGNAYNNLRDRISSLAGPLKTTTKLIAVAGAAAVAASGGLAAAGIAAGLVAAAVLKVNRVAGFLAAIVGTIQGLAVHVAHLTDQFDHLTASTDKFKTTITSPFVHLQAIAFEQLAKVMDSPSFQKISHFFELLAAVIVKELVPVVYGLAAAFQALFDAIANLDFANLGSRVIDAFITGFNNGKKLADAGKAGGATLIHGFEEGVAGGSGSGRGGAKRAMEEMGQSLILALIKGFSKPDLDALSQATDAISEAIQSQFDKGGRTELSIVPDTLKGEGVVAQALADANKQGGVTDAIIANVRAKLAEFGPFVQDYVEALLRGVDATKRLEAATDAVAKRQSELDAAQSAYADKQAAVASAEDDLAAAQERQRQAAESLLPLTDQARDIEQEKLQLIIDQTDRREQLVDIGESIEDIDRQITKLEHDQTMELRSLRPLQAQILAMKEEEYQKTLQIEAAQDALIPLQQRLNDLNKQMTDLQKQQAAALKPIQEELDTVNKALDHSRDAQEDAIEKATNFYGKLIAVQQKIIDDVIARTKAEVDGAQKAFDLVDKRLKLEDRAAHRNQLAFALQREAAMQITNTNQRLFAIAKINRAEAELAKKNAARVDRLRLEQQVAQDNLDTATEARDEAKKDAEEAKAALEELQQKEVDAINKRFETEQKILTKRAKAIQEEIDARQKIDEQDRDLLQAQIDAAQADVDRQQGEVDRLNREQELINRREAAAQHELEQSTTRIENERAADIEHLNDTKDELTSRREFLDDQLDDEVRPLDRRLDRVNNEINLRRSFLDEAADKENRPLEAAVRFAQAVAKLSEQGVAARQKALDAATREQDAAQKSLDSYTKIADKAKAKLDAERDVTSLIDQQRQLEDAIASALAAMADTHKGQRPDLLPLPTPAEVNAFETKLVANITEAFQKVVEAAKKFGDTHGGLFNGLMQTAIDKVKEFLKDHPIPLDAIHFSIGGKDLSTITPDTVLGAAFEHPLALLGGVIGAKIAGPQGAAIGAGIGFAVGDGGGIVDSLATAFGAVAVGSKLGGGPGAIIALAIVGGIKHQMETLKNAQTDVGQGDLLSYIADQVSLNFPLTVGGAVTEQMRGLFTTFIPPDVRAQWSKDFFTALKGVTDPNSEEGSNLHKALNGLAEDIGSTFDPAKPDSPFYKIGNAFDASNPNSFGAKITAGIGGLADFFDPANPNGLIGTLNSAGDAVAHFFDPTNKDGITYKIGNAFDPSNPESVTARIGSVFDPNNPNSIPSMIVSAWNTITHLFDPGTPDNQKAQSDVQSFIDAVINTITWPFSDKNPDSIGSVIQKTFGGIGALFDPNNANNAAFITNLNKLGDEIIKPFTWPFDDKNPNSIGAVISGALSNLGSLFDPSNPDSLIAGIVTFAQQGMASVVSAILTPIKEMLDNIGGPNAPGPLGDLYKNITGTLEDLSKVQTPQQKAAFTDQFVGPVSAAVQGLVGVANGAAPAANSMLGGLKKSVLGFFDTMTGAVNQTQGPELQKALTQPFEKTHDAVIGHSILPEMWADIKNQSGQFRDDMDTFGSGSGSNSLFAVLTKPFISTKNSIVGTAGTGGTGTVLGSLQSGISAIFGAIKTDSVGQDGTGGVVGTITSKMLSLFSTAGKAVGGTDPESVFSLLKSDIGSRLDELKTPMGDKGKVATDAFAANFTTAQDTLLNPEKGTFTKEILQGIINAITGFSKADGPLIAGMVGMRDSFMAIFGPEKTEGTILYLMNFGANHKSGTGANAGGNKEGGFFPRFEELIHRELGWEREEAWKSELQSTFQMIRDNLGGTGHGDSDWLGIMTNAFNNLGKKLVDGMIAGMNSKLAEFIAAIVALVKDAVAGAETQLNINSPAPQTIPMGSALIEGVEVGAEKRVKKLAHTLASTVVSAVTMASARNFGAIRVPGSGLPPTALATQALFGNKPFGPQGVSSVDQRRWNIGVQNNYSQSPESDYDYQDFARMMHAK